MRDEKGYIQFRCEREDGPPPTGPPVEDLIRWRQRLYGLGLVGVYPDGIGYGNLSARLPGEGQFLISGTATGGLPALGPEHFCEVVACDAEANWLRCRGPVRASSESLSHAAVYRADPMAAFVYHAHSFEVWERLRDRVPTTDARAEAGTPEMARAIAALLRDGAARTAGFFVMGGHREGLMAFGPTADAAGERLLGAVERLAR